MTTAHRFEFEPVKTYATRENAQKAVEKVYGPNVPNFGQADLQYFIATHTDGRFFPVFIGERALRNMAHMHFHVAA